MSIHCPYCRHQALVCTDSDTSRYHNPRLCLACGKRFTPVRIPVKILMQMENQLHRKKAEVKQMCEEVQEQHERSTHRPLFPGGTSDD